MEARLPEQSTTEIVQSLFGRAVGPCWADYSCSYHRQHGRLYISTKAVCFYSNLFGFERRLCLLLTDVDLMELHRSSSIIIRMMDGEDFVFKSLTDREAILKTLTNLKSYERPFQFVLPQLDDRVESGSDELDEGVYTLKGLLDYKTLSPHIRRRAQSEPHSMNVPEEAKGMLTQEINSLVRSRTTSSVDYSSVGSPPNFQEKWEKCKCSDDPPYDENVIKNMKIHCSLDDFYDELLADDATWSIPRFQRDIVGDSEIEVSPWALYETAGETITRRTITFQHPIKAKFGIGPFSALARREQRLLQYGTYGMSLETSSFVKGVPAWDRFYVDDRWLIEQHDGYVLLTVQYQTRFTSQTILKRLIIQSTKLEVKSWYDCYAKLLANVFPFQGSMEVEVNMKQEDDSIIPTTPKMILTEASQCVLFSPPVFILIFSLIMIVQTCFLQQEILILKRQLHLLKEEQLQSTKQLSLLMGEARRLSD